MTLLSLTFKSAVCRSVVTHLCASTRSVHHVRDCEQCHTYFLVDYSSPECRLDLDSWCLCLAYKLFTFNVGVLS